MIIILDDDESYSKTLSLYIKEKYPTSHPVLTFNEPKAAEDYINSNINSISLVIIDYRMPEITGIEFIERIQKSSENFQIIILTALVDAQLTYSIKRINLFDLIEKSQSFHMIVRDIEKAISYAEHLSAKKIKFNAFWEKHAPTGKQDLKTIDKLICKNDKVLRIKKDILKISRSDAPCLILGESGTGKEMIANAIYEESSRKSKKFVSLNCAAIPRELLESELFGYKKGAFTGAQKDKPGILKTLDGGTLFLDEITELPVEVQAKLLRFLQEGSIQVIGSNQIEQVSVRIIAATNKNIKEELDSARFREDLYYRLNVVQIEIPPLRERLDDLLLLFDHYLDIYSRAENKQKPIVEEDVIQKLLDYPFPGNIRELKNLAQRLSIFSENNRITISDLPKEIFHYQSKSRPVCIEEVPLQKLEYEKISLTKALMSTNGDKEKAAEIIGISRASVYRKIKKYNLEY